MPSRDAKYFNIAEKHEMDQVCKKYECPDAVRNFIKEKAKEGVIKYWTHEKLTAFLAENGFRRAPKAKSLPMAELVKRLHDRCGITMAEAHTVVDTFIGSLKDALSSGETITFQGFGSFKVEERSARKGRNPQTGEEIDIPSRKTVKFVASKSLKEAVSRK